MALAVKRLDRWREVPRCLQEFDHPWAMEAAYVGVRSLSMPTVVQHRSGLRLQVNEFSDLETIWQIFLRRVYDVRRSDRVIVDAGANVGFFSCYAAWRAPQSQVLTIEPFPATLARLRTQLDDNHLSQRVTVLERALGAAPGEVVMPLDSPNSQEKPVLHESSASRAVVSVPSVPLAQAVAALPAQIDLLKMDIEGSEFEVLLHTPPETLRRFRRINVEHHEPPPGSSYTKAGLISHLETAGFTVRLHAGEPASAYGVLHCEQ